MPTAVAAQDAEAVGQRRRDLVGELAREARGLRGESLNAYIYDCDRGSAPTWRSKPYCGSAGGAA